MAGHSTPSAVSVPMIVIVDSLVAFGAGADVTATTFALPRARTRTRFGIGPLYVVSALTAVNTCGALPDGGIPTNTYDNSPFISESSSRRISVHPADDVLPVALMLICEPCLVAVIASTC